MSKTFRLIISSVTSAEFDGEVSSATFPGASGEMTILASHEPLVTTLKEGNIAVRQTNGDTKKFPVTAGVLECSNNRVTVLL